MFPTGHLNLSYENSSKHKSYWLLFAKIMPGKPYMISNKRK